MNLFGIKIFPFTWDVIWGTVFVVLKLPPVACTTTVTATKIKHKNKHNNHSRQILHLHDAFATVTTMHMETMHAGLNIVLMQLHAYCRID